jgi:hypothetical protein
MCSKPIKMHLNLGKWAFPAQLQCGVSVRLGALVDLRSFDIGISTHEKSKSTIFYGKATAVFGIWRQDFGICDM